MIDDKASNRLAMIVFQRIGLLFVQRDPILFNYLPDNGNQAEARTRIQDKVKSSAYLR